MVDLMRIRLREAMALSAMILLIFENKLCTLGCLSNLSCDQPLHTWLEKHLMRSLNLS